MSDRKKKKKHGSSKIRVNRALIATINEELDKIVSLKKTALV